MSGRDRGQAGPERDRAGSQGDGDRQQSRSDGDRDRQRPGSDRERDRDRQRAESDREQRQGSGEGDQNRRAGSADQKATDGSDRADRRSERDGSRDASGDGLASAKVSREQRQQIRKTLIRPDIKPVRNVNFSVSVGVSIPQTVRVYDVPSEIVEVVPQYRGYRYTVVRDEIVIIEPRTRKIVEVIDADLSGSATSVSTSSSGSLRLSREQRTTISRSLASEAQAAIRVGGTAPSCVELSAVPQRIVADVPELKSYRYFAIGSEIAIVEPKTRRIVEIIE